MTRHRAPISIRHQVLRSGALVALGALIAGCSGSDEGPGSSTNANATGPMSEIPAVPENPPVVDSSVPPETPATNPPAVDTTGTVTPPPDPLPMPMDPMVDMTPVVPPPDDGMTTVPMEGDRSPAGVCARWNADRVNLDEGVWSGSTDACDAGDIGAPGRENALRLINLYRWLADLLPVVTDPERDSRAQECALMQEANNALSHTPPTTWLCYTEEGADGAGTSNISTGPGVRSIDLYMVDSGNETTIGHRRWTLSNSLGPIGLGSTGTGSSCFQNLNGDGDAGKEWMAWPSPGNVPLQAFAPGRGDTLDDTGWTIQSDSLDLGDAVVSVSVAGVDMPVTVTQLDSGFGSRFALRFNPDGWVTTAGTIYSVSVTGVDAAIAYDVNVVDCAL